MIKKFLGILALIVFCLTLAMPAQAALRHFKLYVYKATSSDQLNDPQKATRLTDNVAYVVTRYSSTIRSYIRETLYSDRGVTSLSQTQWVAESTFDDTGTIDFWVDPAESGDTKVRILVIDVANGYSWAGDITYNVDHTIIIDEVPGYLHMLTFPWDATADPSTKTDTGVDLRPGCLVTDAWAEVVTVGTAATVAGAGSPSLGYTTGHEYVSTISTASAGMIQDDVFDSAFQMATVGTFQSLYWFIGIGYNTVSPAGYWNILFIER